MGRMDKSREGERGEKSHSGLPPGMDPATAALYANMFGSGSLGGFNPAAASGIPGWGGLPPGFPPTSSAAGLASLAAAQQAQQAAALAGLGPAAAAYQDRALGAWWNLAGLQQMELLSRLQGGLGGSSGGAVAAAAAAGGMGAYGGLHPEHLMNLEILQAQHAAAMAAALSTSKAASIAAASTSSKVPRSTKNGTGLGGGGSKGITSTLSYRGGASTTTTTYSARSQDHLSSSSRPGLEISRLAASSTSSASTSASSFSSSHHHPLYSSPSSSSSSSSLSGRPPPYPFGSSSTPSLSHRYSSPGGLESLGSSHHSDSVAGSSPSLSYGIASLIADKHPSSATSSSSHPKVHSSSSSSLTASSSSSSSSANNSSQAERAAQKLAGNGSVSISKAIRNKELEIIPISPSVKGSAAPHGSVPPHRDKSEPKVSISTVAAAAAARLSNGVPGGAAWREESASVSIEPCGPTPPMPPGPPGSGDDAPLNLSMKTAAIKAVKVGEKREHKDSSLGSLGLGRSGMPQLDFPPGLGGGLGPMLTPSLEVLQSLYGAQPGEPRDVLASMQEALQRQLLGADGKRDEKKKRMEDVQDRSRHLGRGTSKPKKNTVASLLEQCRAAGIKPSSLPLPPTAATSIVATSGSTSPPLHGGPAPPRSGDARDALSITSTSPIFNSSPSPSPAAQSLPPTLLPGLPLGLSSASSSSYPSSVGSPAPPTPIPTPPVTSLSISTVVSSSSSPPSPLPPSEPVTSTATTTTTTVSSSTTTTTTTASSVSAPPSPPPTSTPTPPTTTTTPSTIPPPPQPASPPSTPASVTASPPPPPQSTPTSAPLPVSLPPSLSLSSSVSITSVTPEAAITSTPSRPSVTIHPTTSASEMTPEQEFDKMDNSVSLPQH